MNVASITVLAYDYCLALELEASFIWGSKWTPTKIVFILARYPPFIDVPLVLYYSLTHHIPLRNCLPVYSAASWGTAFGIAMAEAILVLRTYALWACNRRFMVIMWFQYTAIATTTVVVLVIFLRSLKFGTPPLPSVVGCYMVDGNVILVVVFILVVWHETFLMTSTLWVGVKNFRHSHSPMVVTLYQDGIIFFILLLLISSGNLAVLLWGPPELIDLFNTFLRVMHSILSCRVVLHVRSADRKRMHLSSRDVSSLEFRSLHWQTEGVM